MSTSRSKPPRAPPAHPPPPSVFSVPTPRRPRGAPSPGAACGGAPDRTRPVAPRGAYAMYPQEPLPAARRPARPGARVGRTCAPARSAPRGRHARTRTGVATHGHRGHAWRHGHGHGPATSYGHHRVAVNQCSVWRCCSDTADTTDTADTADTADIYNNRPQRSVVCVRYL